MADSYLTITAPSEGVVREKMSKFLSFAHPVETAQQAKDIIAAYRKEYYDARHVCWAYMIGHERNEFLSSDNGEPSGTAGKPILGQINSLGLTDVVVVVVRYFGGIKLGTSGLIVAYRQAAREALEAATIVERHAMARLTFHFPYMAMNDVMRLLKNDDIKILEQQFDNSCTISLATRADNETPLRNRLEDIDGVTF